MLTRSSRSLLNLPSQCKTIPIIGNQVQFIHALDISSVRAILLRHCNIFEFARLLEEAHQRDLFVYVNVDHIEGIHADAAGLRYLADELHVIGIVSNNPRILALAKDFGLETIQRIFALDSTGLEASLESVDKRYVDLLDISPALVVQYAIPYLATPLPLPFIASGLTNTMQQVQAILRAGALGVAVTRNELWP
jgi:glycerol uptake operon antiterminator